MEGNPRAVKEEVAGRTRNSIKNGEEVARRIRGYFTQNRGSMLEAILKAERRAIYCFLM